MTERRYSGLLHGGWLDVPYEPFRDGIVVHWLVRGGEGEPSLAVLKYEAGATVPLHRHAGLETIVVLDGVQSDEFGDYAAGTVVTNARGTQHSVWSKTGCTVLIQWDLPVVMLDERSAP